MNNKADQLCFGREEMAHQFVDDELDAASRDAFVAHMRTCEACQQLVAELQALFETLHSLEDVAGPVEIASAVMKNLPRPTPWYVRISWLFLAGQIATGLILLALAQPLFTAAANQEVVWQTWLVVSQVGFSLSDWALEVRATLFEQIQASWSLSLTELTGVSISPSISLVIILGLGLAWLIGNAILLRRQPAGLKNGGTL